MALLGPCLLLQVSLVALSLYLLLVQQLSWVVRLCLPPWKKSIPTFGMLLHKWTLGMFFPSALGPGFCRWRRMSDLQRLRRHNLQV